MTLAEVRRQVADGGADRRLVRARCSGRPHARGWSPSGGPSPGGLQVHRPPTPGQVGTGASMPASTTRSTNRAGRRSRAATWTSKVSEVATGPASHRTSVPTGACHSLTSHRGCSSTVEPLPSSSGAGSIRSPAPASLLVLLDDLGLGDDGRHRDRRRTRAWRGAGGAGPSTGRASPRCLEADRGRAGPCWCSACSSSVSDRKRSKITLSSIGPPDSAARSAIVPTSRRRSGSAAAWALASTRSARLVNGDRRR